MPIATAVIRWSMVPRIAPDPAHGGQPDLPNTPEYVNPPDGFGGESLSMHGDADGTLHPNADGQQDIARRLLDTSIGIGTTGGSSGRSPIRRGGRS